MQVIGAIDGRSGARDWVVRQLTERLNGKTQHRFLDVPKGTDVLLSWRFKFIPNLIEAVEEGTCMIHLDLGYFDKRKLERFSVSINGVHGNSEHVDWCMDQPPREHPELLPWREDGEFIQILAPGWKRGHYKGVAADLPTSWCNTTAEEAARAFNMPSKIRQHPRNPDPRSGHPQGTLDSTFEETFCSISYCSSAAINTVIAGVPTVVMHSRSPAYCMAAHDFSVHRPAGREAWLHQLSYHEYDMIGPEELDKAAEFVRRGYEQCMSNKGCGGEEVIRKIGDFIYGHDGTRGDKREALKRRQP